MISVKKLLTKLAKNQIPIGTVSAFAGNTAPAGYLFCNGSAVSRTTYKKLFSVIGTTYGAGDGSTTFNLPNARGRSLVGVDSNDADFGLASVGGEKTHTLDITQLPSHNHVPSIAGELFVTSEDSEANNTKVTYSSSGNRWVDGLTSQSHFHHRSATGATGGGQAHNNMPPYLSLNYIIKATNNI